MKVILLRDISGVGRRYDVKEVKSGYALNALIPRGEAVAATPAALKRIEAEKATAEAERKVREDLVAKNLTDLDGITVTVAGKANDRGHLFAGMHREAVVGEVYKQTKLQLDPSFIMLDHPIKEVGTHTIEVRAGGKSAKFKLEVEAA
jgi:large subunit ribosomal protein L9